MAYQLGVRESIGKGLKRVVRNELRSVIDALDGTHHKPPRAIPQSLVESFRRIDKAVG